MENVPPGQSPPYTHEPVAQSGTFQRPADYYAAPPAPEKKGCGKWGIGCGIGGCLVLLLLFAGGALLLRGGMGRVLDFALSRIDKEAERMMSADVQPAERAEFERQLQQFRSNIRSKKIELIQVQPVIEGVREATRDNVLTAAEVRSLTETMREVNGRAEAPR